MAQVAEPLAPADIGAVSAWLAAQPVPVRRREAGSRGERALPIACGGIADGAAALVPRRRPRPP